MPSNFNLALITPPATTTEDGYPEFAHFGSQPPSSDDETDEEEEESESDDEDEDEEDGEEEEEDDEIHFEPYPEDEKILINDEDMVKDDREITGRVRKVKAVMQLYHSDTRKEYEELGDKDGSEYSFGLRCIPYDAQLFEDVPPDAPADVPAAVNNRFITCHVCEGKPELTRKDGKTGRIVNRKDGDICRHVVSRTHMERFRQFIEYMENNPTQTEEDCADIGQSEFSGSDESDETDESDDDTWNQDEEKVLDAVLISAKINSKIMTNALKTRDHLWYIAAFKELNKEENKETAKKFRKRDPKAQYTFGLTVDDNNQLHCAVCDTQFERKSTAQNHLVSKITGKKHMENFLKTIPKRRTKAKVPVSTKQPEKEETNSSNLFKGGGLMQTVFGNFQPQRRQRDEDFDDDDF